MSESVFSIVESHLKEEFFDGLQNVSGDCSCVLANLAPCGGLESDCVPAYRVRSPEITVARDEAYSDGQEPYHFMSTTKEANEYD